MKYWKLIITTDETSFYVETWFSANKENTIHTFPRILPSVDCNGMNGKENTLETEVDVEEPTGHDTWLVLRNKTVELEGKIQIYHWKIMDEDTRNEQIPRRYPHPEMLKPNRVCIYCKKKCWSEIFNTWRSPSVCGKAYLEKAIYEELDRLAQTRTWEIKDQPQDTQDDFSSEWCHKLRRNGYGTSGKYKDRLVIYENMDDNAWLVHSPLRTPSL